MRKSTLKITPSITHEMFITAFRTIVYDQEQRALVNFGAYSSEEAYDAGEVPTKTLQVEVKGELFEAWDKATSKSDRQAASDNLAEELVASLVRKEGVASFNMPAKYKGDLVGPSAGTFAEWFEVSTPIVDAKRTKRRAAGNLKVRLKNV